MNYKFFSKLQLTALAVLLGGIFAITYLKYTSERGPQVVFDQARQQIITRTYDSYWDWLMERPCYQIRMRLYPKPKFDPARTRPIDHWVRSLQDPQPIVEAPDK